MKAKISITHLCILLTLTLLMIAFKSSSQQICMFPELSCEYLNSPADLTIASEFFNDPNWVDDGQPLFVLYMIR